MDELPRALCASTSLRRSDAPTVVGAVGAYGRQVLGWKSDVDVCFVTSGSSRWKANMLDALWRATHALLSGGGGAGVS